MPNYSIYGGSTSRGAAFGMPSQVVQSSPLAHLLLFNVPLLRDTDDLAGAASRVYFAAGAYGLGWFGGTVYNSLDGSSWSPLEALPASVDWGYAATALPDTVAAFATDHTNTVRVTFSPGSVIPSTISYTELMSGGNPALLGSELIQFQNVTDNGDGTYTLSVLARGRRGTEWATGLHQPGEPLILLELGLLGSYRLPLAQINQVEAWKLQPTGRYLDSVPSNSFAYQGFDMKPYAPVAFSRGPSGSDLLAGWIRRTRFGSYLVDGIDTVPLNEAYEAYEAYVLPNAGALAAFDPTNPATYTRSFTVYLPELTYTAAQMTADGFNPATDTLHLVVYQLTAVVGRGFRGYQALAPSTAIFIPSTPAVGSPPPPPPPPPVLGGDVTYTFTQGVASSVWTIAHMLGRFPSVEIVDSSGNVVEGDIHYVDSNNMTLTFAGPTSGVAYLN